jgi:hypothetical protein
MVQEAVHILQANRHALHVQTALAHHIHAQQFLTTAILIMSVLLHGIAAIHSVLGGVLTGIVTAQLHAILMVQQQMLLMDTYASQEMRYLADARIIAHSQAIIALIMRYAGMQQHAAVQEHALSATTFHARSLHALPQHLTQLVAHAYSAGMQMIVQIHTVFADIQYAATGLARRK